jgi:hypothetical protein
MLQLTRKSLPPPPKTTIREPNDSLTTTLSKNRHLLELSSLITSPVNHCNIISLAIRFGNFFLHLRLNRRLHRIHQPRRTLDARENIPNKTFSPFLQTNVRIPIFCRKVEIFSFKREAALHGNLVEH